MLPITDAMKEHARGCLFGQVIGDSLGAQVEFQSAERIKRDHPKGVREMTGGGPWRIKPGQVTDDSELALALARSIVRAKGYKADAAAKSYVDWKRSAPFDCGGTTANAFGNFFCEADGYAAECQRRAARLAESSQANGSLMRVSPLGIYGAASDFHSTGAMAWNDSALSHANPLCRAACAVYAAFISRMIAAPGGHHPEMCFEIALKITQELRVLGHFNLKPEAFDQVAELLRVARSETQPSDADGAKQGWVAIAFRNAFHQLFTAPDFEEAVVRTISLGGDTDTNAAIAGALYGAMCGASKIPDRWKQTVLACRTDRGPTYQTNDLVELADAILASAPTDPKACRRCGERVGPGRECYAIPTCEECLPPPPPLGVAPLKSQTA